MKSAVVAADVAEGEIANPDGWVAVSAAIAREVIADFLDPEALLLWCAPAYDEAAVLASPD